MQLLEVKNNIAKIIYNPADNKLLPSDFLLIEDFNQKLVGQILSVYTTENSNNNVADVRLALYIDKDEKLSYYNGYIPQKTAKVLYITSDEITEMIAASSANIYLGNLTYHPKSMVKAPMSLVNERLYIQCDRDDNTKTVVQNIVSALYMKQRKVILLDFDGRYNRIANVPRLTITESFNFPLNMDAFNNILEYDTVDCPIEDKAVIQSIVLELRDYVKTLENKFLPFTLFKNVVISEFAANPISGLMVLRNKLWQYAQEGLFAESKADFDIINKVMRNENILIIDASKIEEKWHRFTIQTIPKILNNRCYFAFSMNDIPIDKRSIVSLYNNPNIIPIIATSYDSPHRNLLKSLTKNQILFKPSKQTEVDEQYGTLIHKLNDNDFILFGEASLNLPLIIELKTFDIKTSEKIADQEIRRNVDKILSTGKSMLPKEAVISEPKKMEKTAKYIVDEDFSEDDLDFLDKTPLDEEEKISVEDLKNKQAENVKNKGYDLFEPFLSSEKDKNDDNNQKNIQSESTVISESVDTQVNDIINAASDTTEDEFKQNTDETELLPAESVIKSENNDTTEELQHSDSEEIINNTEEQENGFNNDNSEIIEEVKISDKNLQSDNESIETLFNDDYAENYNEPPLMYIEDDINNENNNEVIILHDSNDENPDKQDIEVLDDILASENDEDMSLYESIVIDDIKNFELEDVEEEEQIIESNNEENKNSSLDEEKKTLEDLIGQSSSNDELSSNQEKKTLEELLSQSSQNNTSSNQEKKTLEELLGHAPQNSEITSEEQNVTDESVIENTVNDLSSDNEKKTSDFFKQDEELLENILSENDFETCNEIVDVIEDEIPVTFEQEPVEQQQDNKIEEETVSNDSNNQEEIINKSEDEITETSEQEPVEQQQDNKIEEETVSNDNDNQEEIINKSEDEITETSEQEPVEQQQDNKIEEETVSDDNETQDETIDKNEDELAETLNVFPNDDTFEGEIVEADEHTDEQSNENITEEELIEIPSETEDVIVEDITEAENELNEAENDVKPKKKRKRKDIKSTDTAENIDDIQEPENEEKNEENTEVQKQLKELQDLREEVQKELKELKKLKRLKKLKKEAKKEIKKSKEKEVKEPVEDKKNKEETAEEKIQQQENENDSLNKENIEEQTKEIQETNEQEEKSSLQESLVKPEINDKDEFATINEDLDSLEQEQQKENTITVSDIDDNQIEISDNKEIKKIETIEQENIERQQKNTETNNTEKKRNTRSKVQKNNEEDDDEIVSIDNLIENIKIQAQNSAQQKPKQGRNNSEPRLQEHNTERKVTKNTPPQPADVTNDRIQHKKLTIYETDTTIDMSNENKIPFKVGDRVYHPKHGRGTVEGFANYSNKILFCQIEFEKVGRRILDPRISGLEKID